MQGESAVIQPIRGFRVTSSRPSAAVLVFFSAAAGAGPIPADGLRRRSAARRGLPLQQRLQPEGHPGGQGEQHHARDFQEVVRAGPEVFRPGSHGQLLLDHRKLDAGHAESHVVQVKNSHSCEQGAKPHAGLQAGAGQDQRQEKSLAGPDKMGFEGGLKERSDRAAEVDGAPLLEKGQGLPRKSVPAVQAGGDQRKINRCGVRQDQQSGRVDEKYQEGEKDDPLIQRQPFFPVRPSRSRKPAPEE